jgi:hypothetical protein
MHFKIVRRTRNVRSSANTANGYHRLRASILESIEIMFALLGIAAMTTHMGDLGR